MDIPLICIGPVESAELIDAVSRRMAIADRAAQTGLAMIDGAEALLDAGNPEGASILTERAKRMAALSERLTCPR